MLREITCRFTDVPGRFAGPVDTGERLAWYAYQALQLWEGTPDREHALVVCLDGSGLPVGHLKVDGLRSAVAMDRALALGTVLRLGAASWMLAHVHPSGDPRPSPEDVLATAMLAGAGDVVDVPLRGHVVVTAAGRWHSVTRPVGGTLDAMQRAAPADAAPKTTRREEPVGRLLEME